MSSSVIGALRVNLGIDSAQFSTGLKSAQTGTERFARAAKTAFAAVAVAAAAMATAFAAGIRSSLNEADNLTKMAQKIGIPVEELSKLKYAADLSGVSLNGLSTSVGRLSRNMADAASGTGEGAKAFKQLGIEVLGADGRLKSSSTIMAEIADRFSTMPDGAQKTALAMQLMGRSGAEMVPLLNGGSAALNGLMAEAKAFGLEISTGTGKAAEQFNDNLARIGYAAQGVTLSLTAALAPALVVVSEAMVRVAQGFVDALSYLPQVAEYAAVAGGAFAVMVAPSILASIGSMTVAIGVGLVGAIKLLTAVIVANPLGALAVGIAAAVTAIYHFRDEIKKAIGIDVVQIVKDAANFVIGSFVAAFEDIKFVWQNFGNIMGAAVVGGVNIAIGAINTLVNGAKRSINDVIALANMIPGVGIGQLDVGGSAIQKIENSYADALGGALSERSAAIRAALSADYIGAIGSAFSLSAPEITNVNTLLEQTELAAGDAGKALKKATETDPWKGLRKSVDTVSEGVKFARDVTGNFISDLRTGLENGKGFWRSFGDAALNVLDRITDRLLNQVLDSIFKVNTASAGIGGGSGGGLLSGIGGFLGKLFSFDGGGYTGMGARSGGVDGKGGFPAILHPNESVIDHTRGGNGAGGHITVSVISTVDENGNITPLVQRVAGQIAGQAIAYAAPGIIERSAKAAGGALGRGDYDSSMANYGVSRQARSR